MSALPSLVGSPSRREPRRNLSYGGGGSARGGVGGGGVTPSSPGHFLGMHGGGASECSAPGPLHLSSPWSSAQQQGYGGGGGGGGGASTSRSAGAAASAAFSSSPGVLQYEGSGLGGVAAASSVSPPGPGVMSRGLPGSSGGGGGGVESAKIVDFSPTWDFSAGGAKVLICLAAPIDFEVGMQGPIVYFADRPVQVS